MAAGNVDIFKKKRIIDRHSARPVSPDDDKHDIAGLKRPIDDIGEDISGADIDILKHQSLVETADR